MVWLSCFRSEAYSPSIRAYKHGDGSDPVCRMGGGSADVPVVALDQAIGFLKAGFAREG
jgi:hypothetical protein